METFTYNELKNKNLSVYTQYSFRKNESILWAVSSVGRAIPF